MRTQKLLIAVVVLQSMILLGQWTGSSVAAPRPAEAQERNGPGLLASGNRDLAVVEELKSLNAKMDKIAASLESGKLQVQVVMPDKK